MLLVILGRDVLRGHVQFDDVSLGHQSHLLGDLLSNERTPRPMSDDHKTLRDHPEAIAGLAIVILIAALMSRPAEAAPVEARFPEGETHGNLLVRSLAGETIGQGEMTQVIKEGDLIENRLVFRFKDGSLQDEKVIFSQLGVFTLMSYRLVQQGPSFPEQLDVSIDRGTGEYTVRSKTRAQEKEDVSAGQTDLPKDVYNGMLITVSKNLQGADEIVSIFAFTPTPHVIKVQLLARDTEPVHIGDRSSKATQYVFKPQIGMIQELLGKAAGRLPAQFQYDCWIMVNETPSFVKFEGPLQLMGPTVRIEPVSLPNGDSAGR